MNVEEEKRQVMSQIDYLEKALSLAESRMLSEEEIAYVRNRKQADEHATWAWQQIKTYAPWVVSVVGAVGSGAYWLVTHFSLKPGP
jgi:hypothetical protein